MKKQKFLILFSVICIITGFANLIFDSYSIGNSNILEITMLISISAIISTFSVSKLTEDITKKTAISSKSYVLEESLKIFFQKDDYLYTISELNE